MTELGSVKTDLCLGCGSCGFGSCGFGRCSLLLGPLLGLQHLSLDLLRRKQHIHITTQKDREHVSRLCGESYLRVMLEDGMTSCCLGIGVQFKHNPQVLQRILLQHSAMNLLAVITLCSVNNVDLPCQIQTRYEKLLLRTPK